jgi:hypothetical protein
LEPSLSRKAIDGQYQTTIVPVAPISKVLRGGTTGKRVSARSFSQNQLHGLITQCGLDVNDVQTLDGVGSGRGGGPFRNQPVATHASRGHGIERPGGVCFAKQWSMGGSQNPGFKTSSGRKWRACGKSK